MSKVRKSMAEELKAKIETLTDTDLEEFKRRGNPEALIEYWRDGPGHDRIRWGEEKDFTRCMKLVGKYIPDQAGGFCQNRHMEIFGEPNATRDKRVEGEKNK